jgi:hypothetical protein
MRRTAQLLRSLLSILTITAGHGIQFLWLTVSSRAELSAEVLFLRKQLAFYQEHQSATQAHRRSAVLLGAMVSPIQLESGIGDRQTGDPHRLASQGGSSCFGGGSRGWDDRGFRKIFASCLGDIAVRLGLFLKLVAQDGH